MKQKNNFSKSLKLVVASFWVIAATFTISSCDKESLEEVTPLSSTSVDDVQGVQENGAVIPGKYIVVFKHDADFGLSSSDTYERRQAKMKAASQALLRGKGIAADRIGHVYGTAIKGMSVGLSNAELQRLRQDPRVAYIEQDRVIKLAPPADKGPKKGGGGGSDPVSDPELPWGILRVGGYGDGAGKTAWVIDTGIDLDHVDLEVDGSRSASFITSGPEVGVADDFNGHGTHVAGTIAAKKDNKGVAGVAAGATVIAVKVLDRRGSGSYSGVIAGVNYVAEKGKSGDVANMSLGGPGNTTLDNAVINAASKGIKFSIAAGNDGAHAGNYSPARVNGNNIYTIAAIGQNSNGADYFASWSNYGIPPVDYAAPGVGILSTWKDGGYNTISGTSMAAPHVAGLLLLGNISSDGAVSRSGVLYNIAHR